MADYDIGEAFSAIEDELISSMIRNLKRHKAEETAEGMNWSQWQVEQLKALEDYKRKNIKKFSEEFSTVNQRIRQALQDSYNDGGTKQERKILQAIKRGYKGKGTNKPAFTGNTNVTGEFFKTNDRKLDSLIKSTTDDMQRAETAVLRMVNDKYRKIIFNAQVYANTGAGTYEKAVDMATKDFLSAGINCIEYKNGRRVNIKSYADMAIRTANKRAYLQGEGNKRKEWGIATVILNKRGNPCPLCAPFVGKVFIDDVWSGGTVDEAKGKGYPLLSEAIKQGLYHPNCQDSHTTYFGDILDEEDKEEAEELKQPFTKEEQQLNQEIYKAEQKQNYYEHQAERMERMANYSLDEENRRVYRDRAKDWAKKSEDWQNEIDKKLKNTGSKTSLPGHSSFGNITKKKIDEIFKKLGYKNLATDGKMSYTKAIKGQHSVEQDLINSNPKRNRSIEYRLNCQRCVPAYELRRRGFDVTAKPAILDSVDNARENWRNIFVNAEWIKCGTNRKETTKAVVIDIMKKFGEGSRAEIFVEWEGKNNRSSHVFVAENVGGNIYFIDPQNGNSNVNDYFDMIKSSKTEICRIDNLEVSDLIKECCK